ncbi:arginine--tRNA ligase [Magnetospirillum gryphiswaldense]|uniref:Arginine--tRNA ligase n=1 Tax=Magnetospirillum gryphiswaldense TaxID=55518 RepID=A4U1L6_9PROT|nr:arginine--tRNA ligase [Magnetospirillum gryphiswaldense]AVM73717.1 Arginine--tRNA ligase [Magnetospirillum gryphiswaldense MSR-1]AVM77620.1 Arginine--tRNA ligase [Magnetospirillum gryphiswaldense]CAM76773.1 Arginyl-tRNA synthetase [Magnetospirillum gryphiswaldense MSR-1]
MNLFKYFRQEIIAALSRLDLPSGLDTSKVTAEPPREEAHGDVATNAAMVLSKAAGQKPRDLAEALAAQLRAHPAVAAVEIAGPGFINLRLVDSFWAERLAEVLQAGAAYGDSDMGGKSPINVEYVSANPTGPMHIGHARGAVIGDALASLLAKAGYAVTREYYINDAGAQVDVLARSIHLRYREALGEEIGEIPEGLYPGDYLQPAGKTLAAIHGDDFKNAPESEWLARFRLFAVDAMMDMIRDDLAALGVKHDVFTSERGLVESGKVDAALDFLAGLGQVYEGVLEPPKGKVLDDWEPRPQTLFRATAFGDDVDRPLKKSDGSWTYFASDIAYHLDKYRRGFPAMIDIWGADHGGYVKRMQAAVKAVSEGGGDLDVKLCQMVNLMKGGQPFKMSKRAGTFVTLRDLVDQVGKDVVRFIMLTRKNDAHLDFDLDKVLEQSRDNPVFYVQYAHARCHSVLRHGVQALPGADLSAAALAAGPLARLTDPAELAVIKLLAGWPRLVESAAEAHEPHRVAFYLNDVAAAFHGLWNKGKDDTQLRFLIEGDAELSLARMGLVRAVADVIASGLAVFGVEPVEEMR